MAFCFDQGSGRSVAASENHSGRRRGTAIRACAPWLAVVFFALSPPSAPAAPDNYAGQYEASCEGFQVSFGRPDRLRPGADLPTGIRVTSPTHSAFTVTFRDGLGAQLAPRVLGEVTVDAGVPERIWLPISAGRSTALALNVRVSPTDMPTRFCVVGGDPVAFAPVLAPSALSAAYASTVTQGGNSAFVPTVAFNDGTIVSDDPDNGVSTTPDDPASLARRVTWATPAPWTIDTQGHFSAVQPTPGVNVNGQFNYGDATAANNWPVTVVAESRPPSATTGTATNIGQAIATLNATVNPNGRPTAASFEYGTTTSYGSLASPAFDAGSGTVSRAYGISVTGLACGTTYQFRATAQNADGAVAGENNSFSTSPCPSPPSAPATISATDGTLADRVDITWGDVAGEDGYQVFRCATLSTATCGSAIAQTGGNTTSYSDDEGVPGTIYYYRVKACSNTVGCSAFSAANAGARTANLPAVTTNNAIAGSQTAATLYGTVDPNGSATNAWFEYGLTQAYGMQTPTFAAGDGSSPIEYARPLTGLACGTTYQFRAVAENAGGAVTGANRSFETLACAAEPPTAVTGAPSGVSDQAATLNGTADPNGSQTFARFEWGPDRDYGQTTSEVDVGSGDSPRAFTGTLDGLACARTYHYRAIARSDGGTRYGADAVFTTGDCAATPPDVVTNPATGLGETTATLNGTADPNGYDTVAWFEYGITDAFGTTTIEAGVGSGDGAVAYARAIDGLICGTTYFVRAAARNEGGTRYGGVRSFTTQACAAVPPAVATESATGIGQTTLTLNGTVNPNGWAANAWFEYGTTTDYGLRTPDFATGAGDVTTAFDQAVSGLACGTTYHFRAAAQNAGGITYGADRTAQTSACAGVTYQFTFCGRANGDAAGGGEVIFGDGFEGRIAEARGYVTFNEAYVTNPFEAFYPIPGPEVLDLAVTVSGARAGNGTYTLGDFEAVVWGSNGATLDLSSELVGQPTPGAPWGTTPSDGEAGDFNLIGARSASPLAVYYFTLGGNQGTAEEMTLKSMVRGPAENGTAVCIDDAYEENDTPDSAFDVAGFEGALLSGISGRGVQADADWYRIEVTPGSSRVRVEAGFTHANGNVDIALYDPVAADFVAFGASSTDDELIEAPVSAGAYLLRVDGTDTGNSYDLKWQADDAYEVNNRREDATDLSGIEAAWLSTVLGPGVQKDDDWYRVEVAPGDNRLRAELAFTHDEGDIDLWLVDAAGDIVASSTSFTDGETVEASVAAGTYYLRVYYDDAGNAYDLRWDGFFLDEDAYEENDSLETAYDLTGAEGVFLASIDGFGVQADDDWFLIDIAPERTRLRVDLSFNHADGNIDLALYGPGGEFIAASTGVVNDEQLDLPVSPGLHYLRVYQGNAGNSYNLRWEADDAYEENDQQLSNRDMSAYDATWLSAIAGPGVQSDDDWYLVNVGSGDSRLVVDLRFSHAQGDLDLVLTDFRGDNVFISNTATDNEYLDVPLSPGGWFLLVTGQNAGTVYDLWWDSQPESAGVLSLDPTAYAVNETAGTVSVTVTRTQGSAGPVSVFYFTDEGPTVEGIDYGAVFGTLTFADGDTTPRVIDVPIFDDGIFEPDETFRVGLTNVGGGAVIGNNEATITILDDDTLAAEVLVSPTGGLVTSEDGQTDSFAVTLGAEPIAGVTIPIASLDPAEATVNVSEVFFTAENWYIPQQVTVRGVDDDVDDGDQGFTIAVGNPVSADPAYNALGDGDTPDVTGVNEDNDFSGEIRLLATNFTVQEGAGSVDILVERTGDPTGAASVDFLTFDETAVGGVDYAAQALTLGFADGETGTKTVPVPIVNDEMSESTEYFTVFLHNPVGNVSIALEQALVAIEDDDCPSRLAFVRDYPFPFGEGDGTLAFEVERNCSLVGAVSVDIAAIDGTAVGGEDFVLQTPEITFADGEGGRKDILVALIDDALIESTEAFDLTLTNAVGAVVDPSWGTVFIQIQDNDTAGVAVNPDFVDTGEDGSSGSFEVVLTAPPSADVTIPVFSSDETEAVVTTPTLVFTPSDWSTPQTVTVVGVDDTEPDGDWPYTVVLGDPSSADPSYDALTAADTPDISGTNLDDDANAWLGFADPIYYAGEGESVRITVFRSNSSLTDVSVDWQTVDGVALAGSDFVGASGTLYFPPGVLEQSFDVEILSDAIPEGEQEFTVTLGNVIGPAELFTDTATVVIQDGE